MCCDQSGAVMVIYHSSSVSCHKKRNKNSPTEAFEGLGLYSEHLSRVWEALFSARGLSLHLVWRGFRMRGWRHKELTVWRNYNSSASIKDHCVRPEHLTAPIMPPCRNQTLRYERLAWAPGNVNLIGSEFLSHDCDAGLIPTLSQASLTYVMN